VVGLATDYCVKFTALDSLSRGYDTIMVLDAVRGVEQNPGDSEAAIDEFFKMGGEVTLSETLLKYGL